ncbi:hypothetical protein JCM18909_3738 [Cutibacterium acnes JCM 18909]|nr:hypothetical protein JCM18909_3738 [Cutibacterium acnes JCM 18909]
MGAGLDRHLVRGAHRAPASPAVCDHHARRRDSSPGDHPVRLHSSYRIIGARDDEDPIPVLHALKPFGVSRVLLAHDSITSYLGALGDQLGVVTASGTGVITLAVGRHNVARVDGWGYIIGDAGSAFWLGRHGWMLSCAPTMVAASRQSLATPSATTLTTSRLPTWNSMPTRSWSHGSRPTQPQSPPQPKKGTTSPVISACAQPMS